MWGSKGKFCTEMGHPSSQMETGLRCNNTIQRVLENNCNLWSPALEVKRLMYGENKSTSHCYQLLQYSFSSMYNSCICFPHTPFQPPRELEGVILQNAISPSSTEGTTASNWFFLDHCIFSFHLGVHSLETVLHKIVLLVVAAKRMKEEEQELPNLYYSLK